jgi:hypothetical protein
LLKSISKALFTTSPSVASVVFFIGKFRALNYSIVLIEPKALRTALLEHLISCSEVKIAKADMKQEYPHAMLCIINSPSYLKVSSSDLSSKYYSKGILKILLSAGLSLRFLGSI